VNETKVGDSVKITDGSYAVRIDAYEKSADIGLCSDTFKVLYRDGTATLRNMRGVTAHDIHIKNTVTGKIYLHSLAFVKKDPLLQ